MAQYARPDADLCPHLGTQAPAQTCSPVSTRKAPMTAITSTPAPKTIPSSSRFPTSQTPNPAPVTPAAGAGNPPARDHRQKKAPPSSTRAAPPSAISPGPRLTRTRHLRRQEPHTVRGRSRLPSPTIQTSASALPPPHSAAARTYRSPRSRWRCPTRQPTAEGSNLMLLGIG